MKREIRYAALAGETNEEPVAGRYLGTDLREEEYPSWTECLNCGIFIDGVLSSAHDLTEEEIDELWPN